eukprot:6213343-Pleurochrysis_carterae.AAC.7
MIRSRKKATAGPAIICHRIWASGSSPTRPAGTAVQEKPMKDVGNAEIFCMPMPRNLFFQTVKLNFLSAQNSWHDCALSD